jgi:integrase
MSLMLDAAVKDARLSRNPATGVELPRLRAKEPRFLTADQVQMLASAAGDYGDLILLLSTTGLRSGEATELRVSDIDLLPREVRVSRSVSDVDGQLVWSTPKTHAFRTVALPPFSSTSSALTRTFADGAGSGRSKRLGSMV